jgi:hypothetical protein
VGDPFERLKKNVQACVNDTVVENIMQFFIGYEEFRDW